MIPPPLLGASIWCGKDRVEICLRQITNHALRCPFALYAEYATGKPHRGGIAISDMLKEGTDGCQSHIACPDAITTFQFEMVKERKHHITVEVFNRKLACRFIYLPGSENQKEF